MSALGITHIPSFEFPPGTRNDYLEFAGLLFGTVRGVDTLVTSYLELDPYSAIVEESMDVSSPVYSASARGEQEYHVTYADTSWRISRLRQDVYEGRPHIPIGIEVGQSSYAWTNPFARRFVIFDFTIRNISDLPINQGCVGFQLRASVSNESITTNRVADDIAGLISVVPGIVPETQETLYVAWVADNDGRPPEAEQFVRESMTGILGVRVLRRPPGGTFSFNWWADRYSADGALLLDWGPRHSSRSAGYAGYRGLPFGDRATYKMMTNGEIDYDQVLAAIDHQAQGWSPPLSDPTNAVDVANGLQTEFIMSYGKIDPILPGDSVSFSVALIAGGDFHRHPLNFRDNFDAYSPKSYLDNLSFADLIRNARWADWVFDNPGFDTDGNGYRGRAHLVNCSESGCDSVFFSGDGIPDLQGPQAPPLPEEFTLTTGPGVAKLRWTGRLTETTRDPLSRKRDFEGYRFYAGKFDLNDQYSLVASWDRVDFKRIAYDTLSKEWLQISDPLGIEQWKVEMEDQEFSPTTYRERSCQSAYVDTVTDTLRDGAGAVIWIGRVERWSYWEEEDYNRGNEYQEMSLWVRNPIQRVELRDTVIDGESLAYGVYEATITNLSPAIPLFFAVTTFDFGNFEVGLEPIETLPTQNSQYGVPIHSADVVADSGLRVGVYPNPYKSEYSDAFGNTTTYYAEGYEGRGSPSFDVSDRRIHFFNLPDTAVISIYSLDGDLIRRVRHPDQFLSTYSSSLGWDLLSRNGDPVVSGLYIWKIDSRLGSQVGKLVIIK